MVVSGSLEKVPACAHSSKTRGRIPHKWDYFAGSTCTAWQMLVPAIGTVEGTQETGVSLFHGMAGTHFSRLFHWRWAGVTKGITGNILGVSGTSSKLMRTYIVNFTCDYTDSWLLEWHVFER